MYTIADSKINFMEYTMKNIETYEQMIKRLNRNACEIKEHRSVAQQVESHVSL